MRTRHILFAGLMALTLIPACASEDAAPFDSVEDDQTEISTSEAAADGKSDLALGQWTYYSVRRDFRRCVAPLCGGWYVKRVNQTWTPCPGGGPSYDPNWTTGECYVAEADFSAAGLESAAGELWRGTVRSKVYGSFGNLRSFRGTEAWHQAGTTAPTGLFYRAADRGINCITFPCPTHLETKLNSYVGSQVIAGVDLTGAGAAQEDVDAAYAEMAANRTGVLVAGRNVTVTGPAGRATALKATQFFTPIRPVPTKKCYKGGCSGQVCSDRPDVVTTCIYRAEYACYQQFGTCELQADGECAWTKTADLTQCLANPPTL